MNYTIITPIKNEKPQISRTIKSVLSQTILPREWIIINDNSTDGTEIILEELKGINWISVYKPTEYRINDYSSRVVYLFNYGLRKMSKETEYICKLDGDVELSSTFYENILNHFKMNSKLAIASGQLNNNGAPEKNRTTKFICTRGATKVYRKVFLDDMGGIVSFQGWDTLDNVAARARGWEVAIINENFEHLKKEGSRVGSSIYSNFRTGYYNGSLPYLWYYFLLKALSLSFKKPFLLGSLLQVIGYLFARIRVKKSPYPDYVIKQLHYEQKQFFKK